MTRLLIIVLLLLAAGPASALESTPVVSARATVTLISDTDQAAAGKPFRVGLRILLAPGWHTYWQNPELLYLGFVCTQIPNSVHINISKTLLIIFV